MLLLVYEFKKTSATKYILTPILSKKKDKFSWINYIWTLNNMGLLKALNTHTPPPSKKIYI